MLLKSIMLATSLFTADAPSTPVAPGPNCGPRKEIWAGLKENEWRPFASSIMTMVAGMPVPDGQALQVLWINSDREMLLTVEQASTGIVCMVYRSKDTMIFGPETQTQ